MATSHSEDYNTGLTLTGPLSDQGSATTQHLSHRDLSSPPSDNVSQTHLQYMDPSDREELISSTGGRRTSSKGKISLSAYKAQRSREADMTKDMKGSGLGPVYVQVTRHVEMTGVDALGSPVLSGAAVLPSTMSTSTPMKEPGPNQRTNSTCSCNISKDQVHFSPDCYSSDSLQGSAENLVQNPTTSNVVVKGNKPVPAHLEVLEPEEISVPIKGYEIMDQRARFTVFKLQVCRSAHDCWYVFRRYTDFVQLNDKLFVLYPSFQLSLPPKKWFGSNFDQIFLEDRVLGLQAFINNITGHKDVCNSKPVREFFCFDDPPGPHDSLEESRALCESLEEQVYNGKKVLQERDEELSIVREERDMYKAQVESLQRALRLECNVYSDSQTEYGNVDLEHIINRVMVEIVERTLNGRTRASPISPQSTDTSLAECDQSETELAEHPDTGEKSLANINSDARTLSPESGICEGTLETPTSEIAEGENCASKVSDTRNTPQADRMEGSS